MDRESVDELRRELQTLEESLNLRERELEQRQQASRTASTQTASTRASLDSAVDAKVSVQLELREASRQKQVLEDEKRSFGGSAQDQPQQTREELVGQIIDGDERREALNAEVKTLSKQINDMKEKRSDSQKRLTVVRLMSMLDDLQTSLNAKVDAPGDDVEEARAQELVRTLQELSRERERALLLLSRKECEMASAVELKKKRIEELRMESDRNRSALQEGNDAEVYGVIERIQKERRILISDIQRLEETSDQLERVVLDTRYSARGATNDRKAALGAEEVMGTSKDPEEEKNDLRARIIAANAEKRRYEMKTEALQKQSEEDAANYDAKMSSMLKEILAYEEENEKMRKGNLSLKALCDSIAASLEA